jgi:[acyl-carrier-protein] S-malonyltransferase
MPKAFIFPGQGSQYVGMGADLHNAYKIARERYTCATDILGYNITEISFHGPEEELRKTQFTQPAIFVHSVIIDDYLKNNGTHPDAVAGHSLGEFSALFSAGVLSFEDALQIVKIRSQAMEQASETNPGSMAAIIGADEKQLETICDQAGVVLPANLNAPGQVVISGEIEAINRALVTAKELGIRRAVALNVSGAFHSPLMTSARKPLQDVINSVNFLDATVPVYQNFVAKPVIDSKNIRQNILNQLENPVLWLDTIITMRQNGITEFIEVGPGKVLNGLNRCINKEIITHNCDKMENLNACEML